MDRPNQSKHKGTNNFDFTTIKPHDPTEMRLKLLSPTTIPLPSLRNMIHTKIQYAKFCGKTDFDMAAIAKEESEYVPLPNFYTFPSREEREHVLFKNCIQVGVEVKNMIAEIQRRAYAKLQRLIMWLLLVCLGVSVNAVDWPSLMELPPFEQAVLIIKYYESLHRPEQN